MAYYDEYEKKQPSKKDVAAMRKKNNASNMQEICNMDAKAKKAGISYGQYVALQYAENERQLRLSRKTTRDALNK